MKCFSTVACMDATFDKLLDYAQRHGMDGVEIRLGAENSVCGVTDPTALVQGKALFERAGVRIVALGSSVCLRGYDDDSVALGKKAIDRAALLNVKAIRFFLGNFAQRIDSQRQPIDHHGIVRALKVLCDYGRECGVEIWIETHNEYSTGEVLSELLRDVSCDNLKIIWDVMHPIEAGESIEDTWRFLTDCIAHVHIKDGFKRNDPSWYDYQYTRLGEGEIPLDELFALLERVEYEGFVSLEWEMAWRAELREYGMTTDEALTQFNKLLNQYQRKG